MPGKQTKTTSREKARRENEREQAAPATRLDTIRDQNSSENALERDVRTEVAHAPKKSARLRKPH